MPSRRARIGVEVTKSLTPGQAFIKVVHEELVAPDGRCRVPVSTCARSVPSSSCSPGLQGAGKTTTAGKLARWLIEKQNARRC